MLRVLALDSDEEDESCDNPTAITFQSLPHIEKLVSERKIYMRAALKLLDQRDRFLEEQIPKRSVVDVIKYGINIQFVFYVTLGTLKKATGGSVTRVWKEKYVELRHGKFSYGDHTGWGQTSNWKTIPLIATEIRCYQISSNGVENRYIFAIKDTSHKRLWMTDSLEEMMSWIDAIKTAMIGSAGDFASDDVDIDSNCSRNDVKLTDHVDTATLHSVAPIHLWCRPEYIGNESTDYIEGLPAYMSAEIRKFLSIQEAISKSSNSTSYRELLSLYFSEPQFTVPVSFIKVVGIAYRNYIILVSS